MQNLIITYKPIGLTPLQAISRFKETYPAYAGKKISYAGRLDPMAEGLLLLLIDEENKKRKEYESLNKIYEFSVLLGIETDTYDILGKIINPKHEILNTKRSQNKNDQNSKSSEFPNLENLNFSSDFDIRISNLLHTFIGKRLQPYPPYSSRTVDGKPLFWWARKNRLHEITIPTKEIEIYNLKLISTEKINKQVLRKKLTEKINKISGDFRQADILKDWVDFFAQTKTQVFNLHNFTITCSSGTYVRNIAQEIGQILGCGAIAYSIKRTAILGLEEKKVISII